MRAVLVAAALGLALVVSSADALRLPAAPRCPVFPADNAWNRRVDHLPVAANSRTLLSSIGLDTGLHADFGSGTWEGAPIGIPITVVRRTQRKTRVAFEYADESDRVRYPIPRSVKIEGGRSSSGDRHALIVDRDSCTLYELFALYPTSSGGWRAGSGAVWNLRSNRLRPAGWTSADAAGLPILPGLARYDEVARGRIDHALRFTVRRTRRAYMYPARHFASESNDPTLPPMGVRVRLRATFDVRGFPPQARVILTALKRYGMMLADNGSDWFISGAPHPSWNNDQLRTLRRVRGADFEVVDSGALRPGR
jgi:hypothetical protein